ncbi:DUF1365 family protein [Mesorhizobium zhangyense]|uniref:DUF1365 family protein n=1 Tax=Mesorhizobium zhangyense TaxID=1776730 RepID=UPI0035E41E0A
MRLLVGRAAKSVLDQGREKLGTASLSLCLLKFPLMTWKIMAGIHWEALKLWLKGARFKRSPPAPETVSYRDHGGAFEPGE